MALLDLVTAIQAHPGVAIIFASISLTLAWALRTRQKASRQLNLPFLAFEDGDDSRQRYVTDSGTLFKIGYERYLKHGKAFKMRNYIEELPPQVYLPLKYLDEVKSAPQAKLSFPYFSALLFSQDHTGMAKQTDEAAHVIRTDLIRNQPFLYPGLEAERAAVIDEKLPRTKEWQSVNPYPIFAYIIARLAAKTFASAELSRNDEWLGIMIGVTQTSMAAAHALRASWPWWTRWLARYVFPPVKKVVADRARAAEILRPILEERVAALHSDSEKSERPNDGIQWLVEYYHARGKGARLTPELLAQNQLFYAMAAIHSSTAILLSVLYDLIDERQANVKAELVDEIEQVHKEFGSWTRQAVSKLVKLDSFMKESQRVHYVGHARVTRAAQVPYTFKDGLHLPKGTMIQFLHSGPQQDPDFFPEPETFDPWRFLKKRQQGDDVNKFQFASLSEVETTFGAGFHACPARNYASDVMKLVLVYLLTKYDIKYDGDSQTRPPEMAHDSATMPSLATSILYREKRAD
ncbi:cytochrome P450 [Cercophora newfieldiana]|uniref:Cytochrome P450 n=1 Tax=Cercophora newfieldiana TaxID=92897 RepID=A0AA39XYN0_9PEZI|nr:cytochrome P450 [Cercophora newfieldiana]